MKLVDNAVLAAVRILLWLLRKLPRRSSRVLASLCVRAILFGMPRLHRVGLRNLELVFPEKSEAERLHILRQSYEVLAENLRGFARVPDFNAEVVAERYDLEEFVKVAAEARADAPGVGVLFAGAHFGNFEEGIQACALADEPASLLARGFGLPKLDAWWNGRRERFGHRMFWRKGGFRVIAKELASGRSVALLCDQNVKKNHAVFVDFFGIPAATTKGVALAAMRTGAPIVFSVFCTVGVDRYSAFCRRIPNPNELPGTADEKIAACTQSILEALEEAVRRHPDHWFWIHRRFKTRPPGEKPQLYA